MKWIFLLLFGAWLMAGCGQADSPSTTPLATDTPVAEKSATLPPPTEPPVMIEADSTIASEQAAATDTAAPPTNTVAPLPAEPTDASPTATVTAVPAINEQIAFNGTYENSYFRGSADAPVTLIDYSDFL